MHIYCRIHKANDLVKREETGENLVFAVIFLSTPAASQSLDTAALKEIRLFAEEFCGELLKSGEGRSFEVDGTAQANLKGFTKKLANTGFEGAIGFDESKYIGVLREDLAGERNSVRDCKLLIWKDLRATIVQILEKPSSNTDMLYPLTSSSWLNSSDLVSYSSRDLRIMRNEIYARYGYEFKSADLRAHFRAKSWYQPISPDAELAYNKMSAIERSNVLTIRKEEDRR